MTRVLVADDDPDIRMLMTIGLRRAGFDVEPVADGASALDSCRSATFDVAVLDINMPGMTGLEVATCLRAKRSTASMGIVLVSALATPEDVTRGHDAGADHYLTKPFKVTGLTAAVRDLCARASHPA